MELKGSYYTYNCPLWCPSLACRMTTSLMWFIARSTLEALAVQGQGLRVWSHLGGESSGSRVDVGLRGLGFGFRDLGVRV